MSNSNQCTPTCPVCNHPQIKTITKSINAGIGHAEITKKYGGFGLRTLETHIQNQPGQISYTQVNTYLKDAMPDIKPLSKMSSDEAKLELVFKLLNSIERVQDLAVTTQSLKAEQQLGELILKASNILSTLDYDAMPE